MVEKVGMKVGMEMTEGKRETKVHSAHTSRQSHQGKQEYYAVVVVVYSWTHSNEEKRQMGLESIVSSQSIVGWCVGNEGRGGCWESLGW